MKIIIQGVLECSCRSSHHCGISLGPVAEVEKDADGEPQCPECEDTEIEEYHVVSKGDIEHAAWKAAESSDPVDRAVGGLLLEACAKMNVEIADEDVARILGWEALDRIVEFRSRDDQHAVRE